MVPAKELGSIQEEGETDLEDVESSFFSILSPATIIFKK